MYCTLFILGQIGRGERLRDGTREAGGTRWSLEDVCFALEHASLLLFGVCVWVGRYLIFLLSIHGDNNNPLSVFVPPPGCRQDDRR